MSDSADKIRWHTLFGTLLEHLLTPVGVKVLIEAAVMSQSPRTDILLLRRETAQWTDEQKARLPDGVRDTDAEHVLLEFKYSESLTTDTMQQLLGYELFYRRAQNLSVDAVQGFLLSAKTPQSDTLAQFGYAETMQYGVYRSELPLINKVPLLVLNQLDNTPHNIWIRCFSSRQAEKQRAFQMIQNVMEHLDVKLCWYLGGLSKLLSQRGIDAMDKDISPEEIMETGRRLYEMGMLMVPPSEFIKHLDLKTVLQHFKHEDIVENLEPEVRLKGLDAEERLKGIDVEQRLKGLNAEEFLDNLSLEEIETYLRKKRQQH